MITGIKFSYLQNEKLVAGGMFKPGIIVTDGYLWKYIWRGILELKCNILNTQLVDETERANVLFARLSQVSGFLCVLHGWFSDKTAFQRQVLPVRLPFSRLFVESGCLDICFPKGAGWTLMLSKHTQSSFLTMLPPPPPGLFIEVLLPGAK